MKKSEIAAGAAIVAILIAAAALYTKNNLAPTPISKDKVSFVMLATAMERVGTAVGPKGEVHQLNCESKGDGNVRCTAIGSAIYRVSFANAAGAPEFELAGQRGGDGKMYVNAFNGVASEIPARDVIRFTSAFDGQATLQAE